MEPIHIRNAAPTDYLSLVSVVNEWSSGRNVRDMLPKLFFIHFCQTSFVAEVSGERVGFLAGFVSQTFPEEAYIHFIGVHPEFRRESVARTLCEHFFTAVRLRGCKVVGCVTSPVNRNSVAFWQRMGFMIKPTESSNGGLSIETDYDGPGEDRVLFSKELSASPDMPGKMNQG